MNADLVSYYNDRAKEYEKVYSKPERQDDLLIAGQILQDVFAGKDVFEIACGTGYWTQKISTTAKNILAIDINDSVIEIAKSKNYAPSKVNFQTIDLFNLAGTTRHEYLFGGFIWSHIKIEDLNSFIDKAGSLVKRGGTIVFMDNIYVEGSNLPVTDRDDLGNTYQTRTLENGSTHKILKNFPSEEFIKRLFVNKVNDMKFIKLHYYWILKYKTV
jgi:demethylmenaquinone methyltransferase/2-methoxy-6-polyprenyl-1,4-benzoquinol methylase